MKIQRGFHAGVLRLLLVGDALPVIVLAGLGALPPIVWLLSARKGQVRRVVAITLIAWAVVSIVLAAAVPRAGAEVVVGYFIGVAAVMVVGRAVENRRLGRSEPNAGSWLYRIMIGFVGLVVCACAPFSFYVFNSEPFVPSADQLLPVPPGLSATVEEPEGLPCGSGACYRSVVVTGEQGQPVSDIYEQIRQHLISRGWNLRHSGQDCRPTGWLLDQRHLCVSVYPLEAAVHVSFEGSRAWP